MYTETNLHVTPEEARAEEAWLAHEEEQLERGGV